MPNKSQTAAALSTGPFLPFTPGNPTVPAAAPQKRWKKPPPETTAVDDTIVPFQVDALDLRGRLVRLGPMVDEILTRHDYPPPVAKLLGEAIVLGVLLGSALKFEGRFILQTQTDGPVRMLVVDFVSPGKVRACARFDKSRSRRRDRRGRRHAGDAARPRPSRHDHRPGRGHEPLSGPGRARRR